MLRTIDEMRHDIERVVVLANDYWAKPGSDPASPGLESQIMVLQNKIVGGLSVIKQLDPERFRELGEVLQDDFIDVLTGGQFQVRDRAPDTATSDRIRRFGGRLSDRIMSCSTTPKATGFFARP
jgi:hypothetical protein